MKLYNTLTGTKEVFVPLEKDRVGMYVCGPTVYDVGHLGHARAAVAFDLIRRYFQYKGYKVSFVSNITDVDDKIIDRANQKGVPALGYAHPFMEKFKMFMKALNVKPPDVYPLVTKTIPDIIELIKKLIAQDHVAASKWMADQGWIDVKSGKMSREARELEDKLTSLGLKMGV